MAKEASKQSTRPLARWFQFLIGAWSKQSLWSTKIRIHSTTTWYAISFQLNNFGKEEYPLKGCDEIANQRSPALGSYRGWIAESHPGPLKLARFIDTIWDAIINLASVGNINYKSDLQVLIFWHLVYLMQPFHLYSLIDPTDRFFRWEHGALKRLCRGRVIVSWCTWETSKRMTSRSRHGRSWNGSWRLRKGSAAKYSWHSTPEKKKSPSEGCFVFS